MARAESLLRVGVLVGVQAIALQVACCVATATAHPRANRP